MSCDCVTYGTGQPCSEEAVNSCFTCKKSICATHTETGGDGRAYCPACALEAEVALCREKVGFLTVKDCKVTAVAACTECARPLCQKHAVASAGGVVCSECAKAKGVTGDYDRRRYDDYYYAGYQPYYWGSDRSYYRRHRSSFYDDSDAEIFDEHSDAGYAGESGDGGFDGDFEAS